jgi:hypothetical protein
MTRRRDGQRPDVSTVPRGTPTLTPLPSLQEPLYVIGAGASEPPKRATPKRRDAPASTPALANLTASARAIEKLRKLAGPPPVPDREELRAR